MNSKAKMAVKSAGPTCSSWTRRATLLFGLLLTMSQVGCAWIQQANALKKCKFSLVSVEHSQSSLTQTTFQLGFEVSNPNPVSANLQHIELRLYADDLFLARGEFTEPVRVGANGSEQLNLVVTVSHMDAARALKPVLSGAVKVYRVDATATVDTPIGSLKYSFNVVKSGE